MKKRMDAGHLPYLKLLLALSAGGGLLATLLGFLGRLWWPFEIMSHFRPQYFLVLTTSSLLLAAIRLRGGASVTALFAVINLALLMPLYRRPVEAQDEAQLRLLSANVRVSNEEPALLASWVKEVQPDLIVLVEATDYFVKGLGSLEEAYPYRELYLDLEPHGMAFLSRRPLHSSRVLDFENTEFPAIVTSFRDIQDLTIVGFHPPPPRGAEKLRQRTRAMNGLAEWVVEQQGEVVVLGDFNSTPWSPFFRDFLTQTMLRQARRGFGLESTWPVGQPLLRIPIDHALISEEILVSHFSAGPDIGSDHYPILVEITLVGNRRSDF